MLTHLFLLSAVGFAVPALASDLRSFQIEKYNSDDQITDISQFLDLKPTDWTYQALSNLVKRYGCVAGASGSFIGTQSLTRYEAAALLNTCLERVAEVTDEVKSLIKEFQKETEILKGRIDSLDTKISLLDSQQFSTTTKLQGTATFLSGAAANALPGEEISLNYDFKLALATSFTGLDLLYTRLNSGNADNSIFLNGDTAMWGTFTGRGSEALYLDRLYYKFPIGSNFTATVGAVVRQDDIHVWPWLYPAENILDVLYFAGAGGVYSLNKGAGFGVGYSKNGLSATLGYVSASANLSTSNMGFANNSTTTLQFAYKADTWGLGVGYTYADGVPFGAQDAKYNNNYGLSGYWNPLIAYLPSFSLGVGSSTGSTGTNTVAWTVGLLWPDTIVKGNTLGFAVGAAGTKGLWSDAAGADDSTLAFELYYKVAFSDNISFTPAIFMIEQPVGSDDIIGGIVKAVFRF